MSLKQTLDEALWLTQNLPIRLLGDPILTKACKPVTQAEIKSGQADKWAGQLIDFLQVYRDKFGVGRGLAANQIGISKQLILVWLEEGPQIYINPKMVSSTGKAIYPESCISAAGLIIGEVIRPWKVKIEYLNLDGQKKTILVDPILSRLLLHEIDHLHGILCSDKYKPGTIKLVSQSREQILQPKLKRLK